MVKTIEEEDQNGEEDNLVLVCERQGEGENSPIGNALLVPEGEIPEGFSQEAIFYFIEKINLGAALATFFVAAFIVIMIACFVILAVQEAQTTDEVSYARGKGQQDLEPRTLPSRQRLWSCCLPALRKDKTKNWWY